MGDTTTTADGILKQDYNTLLGDLINKDHPFLNLIEKDTTGFVGKKKIYGIVTDRNHGTRSMDGGDSTPVAGNVGTVDAEVTAKIIHGKLEINVDLINAAKTDAGAFVKGIKLSMDNLVESCKNNMHRQSFGRPYTISTVKTGVIAKVSSGATSATQTFDSNQYFEQGRYYFVDTISNIQALSGDYRKVVSISTDGVSVTFDASFTTATNDYVVQGDTLGHAYNKEMLGTEFMVSADDDDYLTVDTGDNPGWASTVVSNSGTARPLTFPLLDLTVDTIKIKSGKKPNLWIMDESQERKYKELMRADTRYQPGMFTGGDKEVTYYNGGTKIDIVVDRYAPRGKITFLNTEAIDLCVRQPWGFMQDDGAVLSRVANKRTYGADYSFEGELATNSRNRHGKLTDLTWSLTT